jgi:hypothetical protein
MLEISVVDPDPHFKRIRIQGFDDQKFNKIQLKKNYLSFCDKNCNLLIPRPP